jgi:hypothetical protein
MRMPHNTKKEQQPKAAAHVYRDYYGLKTPVVILRSFSPALKPARVPAGG